jgi:ABC-type branched-subunit amino acid transport system ATPase component/ABC-type branched-subunit amino acid transport system permease subunit
MSGYLLLAILGLGSAAAYSLLATGIVLIYRASGVLNFAQGAFAMVGAYLYYELRTHHGLGFWPAAVVTIVVIAAVGCLAYLLIMAPLRDASPVVRIIATLGLMLALQAAAQLKYGGFITFVPEALPHDLITLGSVAFPADRVWLIGIAAVLVLLMTLVSHRTRFGVLTRAVAENERASAAYGNSPRTIGALNWALGSALAALAGVLIAPVASLSPTSMTMLVVPALAVALFGGFSSFPLTLVGAVIVGVVQGLVTKYSTSLPGLSDLIPLAVVLLVLLVRRRGLPGRGEIANLLPRLGGGRISPLSALALFVVAVVAALALPLTWSIAFGVSIVVGIILLSIVVVTGYAGQLSLGQYALAGAGALAAAQLNVRLGWPFPVAIVLGVVAAAVVGYLFGLPSLMTRGTSLAIVTLTLGAAVTSVVFNNAKFVGGEYGFKVASLSFFGIDLNPVAHPRTYTLFCLCWFAVAVWVARNVRHSDVGRRLISIRANERASAALGIDVRGAKLYAFVVSAGLAGLGGILLAYSSTSILLSQGFDTLASANAVSMAVVGGVGYLRGAAAGGQLAPGGFPGGVIADHVGSANGSTWLALVGSVLLIITLLANRNGIAPAFRIPLPARLTRPRTRPASSAAREDGAGTQTPARHRAAVLSIDGLSVRFGGVRALTDITLDIPSGQVTSLIGPNGAGKTTFIDAVTGFVDATGSIRLGTERLDGLPAHQRARLGLSRGFQSLELFDDITVEENLRAAAEGTTSGWRSYARALVPSRRRPLPAAALAAVREFQLEDDLGKTPKELSFGRRKLVAIARSIATSPEFLLLDEPAAGLSEHETRELGGLIRRLATDLNIGILLIEHDVDLVMSISDNVAVLDFGAKIAEGAPSEVRTDPAVVAAYLGGSTTTTDEASSAAAAPEATSGREMSPTSGSQASADRPVEQAAGARSATFGYDAMPVVRDVDLRIGRGEVVALLGPNGAGKTTTVLSLAGVLKPLTGEVQIGDRPTTSSLAARARGGLGYLAEERSVFMGMTVAENLRVAGVGQREAFGYFPELQRLANRRAGLLSGGEQQMLALAAVLARSPSVILADELSLGLAPIIVDRLLAAIRRTADERGTGVLLVEQHVSKALEYADYVYVIRRGQIVLEGTAAELRTRIDDLRSAYLNDLTTPALGG